jgi:hypothetical protein
MEVAPVIGLRRAASAPSSSTAAVGASSAVRGDHGDLAGDRRLSLFAAARYPRARSLPPSGKFATI